MNSYDKVRTIHSNQDIDIVVGETRLSLGFDDIDRIEFLPNEKKRLFTKDGNSAEFEFWGVDFRNFRGAIVGSESTLYSPIYKGKRPLISSISFSEKIEFVRPYRPRHSVDIAAVGDKNGKTKDQTAAPVPAANLPTAPTSPKQEEASANWPKFTTELTGNREVRVTNPNPFKVKIGIRSGEKGLDFNVAPNGSASGFVAPGKYDIFFQYSSDPTSLYQGDSFEIMGGGIEIQIVNVVGGNYGIRKVK